MNISFLNQTCIVTGGSSGLGKTISLQFLKLGAKVIITGTKLNSPDWVKEFKNCVYIQADFLDKISLNKFLIFIKNLNKIDVLVNNAGIIKFSKIGSKQFEKEFTNVLNVNLYSVIKITNKVVSIMLKNNYGRIVNISSISGHIVKPHQSSYSSTKQGLNGFSKAISIDLAKDGILANSVCPSTINTPMTQSKLNKEQINTLNNNHPLKRLASTDDISNVIIFLSSSKNSYFTGQSIIIDGGLSLN